MTNVSVVTFDVADGSFTFYSKESWETTIEEWRKELAGRRFLSSQKRSLRWTTTK